MTTPAIISSVRAARRIMCVALASASLTLMPGATWAQRGASGPPEHADVEPVNDLPNPYETVRNWGTLPDGRTWGSVSALNIDIDGVHVWVADRCGANSCATSDVDPIVKLDASGNVVQSFGAGLILWPHGMDVDSEGNIWIADARVARGQELERFPEAAGIGSSVMKFSPDGELLLTIGTPGEIGDPPTHLTDPNDVLVAPDGSIFVGEAHGDQFLDEPGPTAIGRISKYAPDGTFIMSFGAWGYEDGQFRAPHSFAMDSQGRLFIADRGNRRIQIFDLEGRYQRQVFVNPYEGRSLTAAGLAFSPDPEQKFIYVADQANLHIHILNRQTLEILNSWGELGKEPGNFDALHHIAVDSKGNLYTAEAQRNHRAQRFMYAGMSE